MTKIGAGQDFLHQVERYLDNYTASEAHRDESPNEQKLVKPRDINH